jgi:hypothetical protein
MVADISITPQNAPRPVKIRRNRQQLYGRQCNLIMVMNLRCEAGESERELSTINFALIRQ